MRNLRSKSISHVLTLGAVVGLLLPACHVHVGSRNHSHGPHSTTTSKGKPAKHSNKPLNNAPKPAGKKGKNPSGGGGHYDDGGKTPPPNDGPANNQPSGDSGSKKRQPVDPKRQPVDSGPAQVRKPAQVKKPGKPAQVKTTMPSKVKEHNKDDQVKKPTTPKAKPGKPAQVKKGKKPNPPPHKGGSFKTPQ